MGVAFLGLYPLAALIMRVFNFSSLTKVHIGLQLLAMTLMYAGLACGIWFGYYDGKFFNSTHTQMGIAIPSLMLLQPFLGYLHHRGYVKTGGRTVMSYVHANYGRILILAGGVCGILGRVDEGDYPHGKTIWTSIFGIMLGFYVIVWGVTAFTKRKNKKQDGSGSEDEIAKPRGEKEVFTSESPAQAKDDYA
jgi:hypothetical protein